jgi:gluconokinase
VVVIVMGVAGSGKTLIGSMLAKSLGWQFADADEFHPAANVEKMSLGIPLTDADRDPWLSNMRAAIDKWNGSGKNFVLACSALKQRYRERLQSGPEVKIVYLKGSPELILSRIAARQGHFMKPEMLASQFADLEEPRDAMIVDVSGTPDEIVTEIKGRLVALSKCRS